MKVFWVVQEQSLFVFLRIYIKNRVQKVQLEQQSTSILLTKHPDGMVHPEFQQTIHGYRKCLCLYLLPLALQLIHVSEIHKLNRR